MKFSLQLVVKGWGQLHVLHGKFKLDNGVILGRILTIIILVNSDVMDPFMILAESSIILSYLLKALL